MCFATAGIVAGMAGAGISAYGAIEGGQATANAANYDAQVARNNAIIANQSATYAEEAGNAQAGIAGMKSAAASGRLKAGQAANGVDVNSGSAVAVQSGQRKAGLLDTATVANNAELQAYGYRSQAAGFNAQAGLETLQAEQAPIGAELSAAGGLLSGATGVASKWAPYITPATPPSPIGAAGP